MGTQRAIMYDRTGDPGELHISTVPVPSPTEERALLEVHAVGINPYDVKVLTGAAPRDAAFPRGIGSDVAGIILALGDDTSAFQVGDAVMGWGLNTLREQLVVRTSSVARVPTGLPLDTAAALVTPSIAATACLRAVPVSTDDVVLVPGASGSVGWIIAQLATRAGARVIGTTGAASHDRLAAAGITPIPYGSELAPALTKTLDGAALTAVLGAATGDVIRIALDAGTAPERIVTLAGDETASEFGVVSADTGRRTIDQVSTVAELVAAGVIEFDVTATYALTETPAAFEAVRSGHGGKIVVHPQR
ncbi:NADP-dependent oxidoreductase [Microbacterium sp. ZW T5_56]|uniref:NADP-dependent oxidoreductase n=1 Tax=Microbacterium sp. ZW T5_56 TaxID=3378081 RepID=UPI0038521880